MKQNVIISVIAIILVCSLYFCLFFVTSQHKQPSIIVILIDTLRKDHLGLYGYNRSVSPFMDKLGKQSLVFQNAFSQSSWTPPSVASFFTSLFPSVHGTVSHANKQASILPFNATTFSEVLQKKGYSTGAIIGNTWLSPELGFAQGFDHFVMIDKSSSPNPLNNRPMSKVRKITSTKALASEIKGGGHTK